MREVSIEAAHIVGHSFGGMIAQQFALDFPDATLSRVLADCPGEQSEAARTTSRHAPRSSEEQRGCVVQKHRDSQGERVAAFRNDFEPAVRESRCELLGGRTGNRVLIAAEHQHGFGVSGETRKQIKDRRPGDMAAYGPAW